MRIVFTRHPGQAGDLEAAAEESGYHVAFMPLTIQVLPPDTAELRAAVARLKHGAFDWLLLTSPNTVRALARTGWDGEIPERTRVAVVGPGTERVLAQATGAAADWMPTDHSAAGLLQQLPAPQPGQRMLLPQSDQARPQLTQGLSDQGWELTHVVAYRTVDLPGGTSAAVSAEEDPTSAADRRLTPTLDPEAPGVHQLQPEQLGEHDLVLVTSSTAAAAYARRRPLNAPQLVAIGEPTQVTMVERGLPVTRTLLHPTGASLIRTVNELASAAEPNH